MTLASALYLLAVGAAALLALWAAGSAAVRNPAAHPRHRLAVFVSGVTLPLVTGAVMVGPRLSHVEAVWLWPLLPLLALMVCWGNAHTIRQHGWGVRALHLPVLLWNCCLVGIHGMRALWELTGLEPGDHGAALLHAYGLVQNTVGQGGAEQFPMWLLLPFPLPIAQRYEWPHKLVLLAVGALATGLVALLVLAMPFAFHQASGYRTGAAELPERPPALALGVVTPAGDRLAPSGERATWQRALAQLGPELVALDLTPAALADAPRMAQAEAALDGARSSGRRTVVFARPDQNTTLTPYSQVTDLATALQELHWHIAEQLQPDVLVLFAGPFGTLRHHRIDEGTVEGWHRVIAAAADAVRKAGSRVALAVSIESRAPHADELFRRLAVTDSPLDLIGVSVFAGNKSRRHLQDDLEKAASLIRKANPSMPVWLLEAGVSPYCSGGELGQWHGLAEILATAVHLELEAVVVRNLMSVDEDLGLLTPLGRSRVAWRELNRWSIQRTKAPQAATGLSEPRLPQPHLPEPGLAQPPAEPPR